ncbi:MAG: periplasmic heavy metal sensor [Acidobacteriales bacterium]|nr:periplasmic heavy metal sensor [Terriglobales bacterium]
MKKTIGVFGLVAVLASAAAWAQQQVAPDPAKGTSGKPFGVVARKHMMLHGPGKWWKDAETVKQVGLTDGQASQIEQVFVEHRMKLIDWMADLQKQELKLQTYLEADQPDEGQVSNQVDQVVAARGKLEKENALMMLNIRRVLTPDQWKKLQSIRGDMAAGGVFFHRFVGPAHMPGDFTIAVPPTAQAPLPPPPPQLE